MKKICIASSELFPFSKAGGLADVTAALGRHLTIRGHDVRVFSPLYATIDTKRRPLRPVRGLRDIEVRLGSSPVRFSIYSAPLADAKGQAYFVHCPELYDRPAIYTAAEDEPKRFILLTRAIFESCLRMKWSPDIVHCHDWPTALGPMFLRGVYSGDPLFESTKTVLTIHNNGYQGVFPACVQSDATPPEFAYLLHQDDLRAGVVNFLKTGLLYADAVTTVSPTYAREIQSEELGAGLQHWLRSRPDPVLGILNGVDYDHWSPQKDPWIEKNYNARGPVSGKRLNKEALLKRFGLPFGQLTPLVAMITRLVSQKGIDILFDSLPGLLEERDFQLVVLGGGEPRYEDFFRGLQSGHPARVCFYEGYNEELAHLLVAASDVFLMPSLYEPCGLGQMYSLKYGTVPVVRKTGGLADTVTPWDPESREGVGFVFEHFTADGVRWALNRALDTHRDRTAWLKLMRNGMATDFSWEKRIEPYLELYESLPDRDKKA